MGGSIWVESEPDKGSCFSFTVSAPKSTFDRVRPFQMGYLTWDKDSAPCVLVLEPDLRQHQMWENMLTRLGLPWLMTDDYSDFSDRCIQYKSSLEAIIVDTDHFLENTESREEAINLRNILPKVEWIVFGGTTSSSKTSFIADIPNATNLGKPLRYYQLHHLLGRIIATPKSDTVANESPKEPLPKKPLNLLLVEDNEINQMVGALHIKKLGFHVEIASNGQEAIEKCRNDHFDIILMDIQMPGMDGIKNNPGNQQTGFRWKPTSCLCHERRYFSPRSHSV